MKSKALGERIRKPDMFDKGQLIDTGQNIDSVALDGINEIQSITLLWNSGSSCIKVRKIGKKKHDKLHNSR